MQSHFLLHSSYFLTNAVPLPLEFFLFPLINSPFLSHLLSKSSYLLSFAVSPPLKIILFTLLCCPTSFQNLLIYSPLLSHLLSKSSYFLSFAVTVTKETSGLYCFPNWPLLRFYMAVLLKCPSACTAIHFLKSCWN